MFLEGRVLHVLQVGGYLFTTFFTPVQCCGIVAFLQLIYLYMLMLLFDSFRWSGEQA